MNQNNADFVQSAFNVVAKIISEHAFPSVECLVPVDNAEQCLSHLSLVASDWSYDPKEIDKLLETIRTFNNETKIYLGEVE